MQVAHRGAVSDPGLLPPCMLLDFPNAATRVPHPRPGSPWANRSPPTERTSADIIQWLLTSGAQPRSKARMHMCACQWEEWQLRSGCACLQQSGEKWDQCNICTRGWVSIVTTRWVQRSVS